MKLHQINLFASGVSFGTAIFVDDSLAIAMNIFAGVMNLFVFFHREYSGRIKRMWFDNEKGKILMHVYGRSGLYYLPIKGGEQYSYWLVEYAMTMKLPKNETIYQLMDIRDSPPKEETTIMKEPEQKERHGYSDAPPDGSY